MVLTWYKRSLAICYLFSNYIWLRPVFRHKEKTPNLKQVHFSKFFHICIFFCYWKFKQPIKIYFYYNQNIQKPHNLIICFECLGLATISIYYLCNVFFISLCHKVLSTSALGPGFQLLYFSLLTHMKGLEIYWCCSSGSNSKELKYTGAHPSTFKLMTS